MNTIRLVRSAALAALSVLCLAGLSAAGPAEPFRIAVFVPGMVQGSPTYEMMAAGVESAKEQARAKGRIVEVKVFEAGFDQSKWQAGLIALASGDFDLVVSSNPSLPDLAVVAAKTLPQRKFLLLDGYLAGNPAIKTIAFDQYQQAWLNGYLAATVARADPKAGPGPVALGLLAGQDYPVMDKQIKPGFLDGARAAAPGATVEFRVLGNWYDAAKARSLAAALFSAKVRVVLAIAGGGNQGVVAAAKEAQARVTWFDDPRYSGGDPVVVGSTVVRQSAFCAAAVLKAIDGTLDYGTPTTLGVKDDAVGYDFDLPGFKAGVGAEAKAALADLLKRVKSGKLVLARKQ